MEIEIEVDPADIVRKQADDRGRITLGSEFASKELRVAIIEVEEDEDR